MLRMMCLNNDSLFTKTYMLCIEYKLNALLRKWSVHQNAVYASSQQRSSYARTVHEQNAIGVLKYTAGIFPSALTAHPDKSLHS